jgi:hypothetical protein
VLQGSPFTGDILKQRGDRLSRTNERPAPLLPGAGRRPVRSGAVVFGECVADSDAQRLAAERDEFCAGRFGMSAVVVVRGVQFVELLPRPRLGLQAGEREVHLVSADAALSAEVAEDSEPMIWTAASASDNEAP